MQPYRKYTSVMSVHPVLRNMDVVGLQCPMPTCVFFFIPTVKVVTRYKSNQIKSNQGTCQGQRSHSRGQLKRFGFAWDQNALYG